MSGILRGPKLIEPKYGRLLDDFTAGEVYHHPWEVTIDDGLLAMFSASFLDPNPLYSSRRFARDLGFRDRIVHPMVLMNLALSFTVHDISEQAIAHLAYIDMRFPNAAYAGDTFTAFSEVLGARRSESNPDRGIVHVRTTGVSQDGAPLITFERKALIPAGTLDSRAHPRGDELAVGHAASDANVNKLAPSVPPEIGSVPTSLQIRIPEWRGRPRGLFEDYEEGDSIVHSGGHTVGESEHMQLAILTRNSHPLHFDEVYSRHHSFAGTRVVEGGLVFAWACSLASRDTTANALWDLGYDRGSHVAPVFAGDTLYAASRVTQKRDHGERAGIVKFHLVGVKNEAPMALLQSGVDLFGGKFEQKVFEIERRVLLPKRSEK